MNNCLSHTYIAFSIANIVDILQSGTPDYPFFIKSSCSDIRVYFQEHHYPNTLHNMKTCTRCCNLFIWQYWPYFIK